MAMDTQHGTWLSILSCKVKKGRMLKMKGYEWRELERILQSLTHSGTLVIRADGIKVTLTRRNSSYVSHREISFEHSNLPDGIMYLSNGNKEIWINPLGEFGEDYVEALIPSEMIKKIFEGELGTVSFKVLHADLVTVKFKVRKVIRWEYNESEERFIPIFVE